MRNLARAAVIGASRDFGNFGKHVTEHCVFQFTTYLLLSRVWVLYHWPNEAAAQSTGLPIQSLVSGLYPSPALPSFGIYPRDFRHP